ncbi:MAG: TrkA family potassium uptake protein [Chloroflexi bacterium]|nr:TrkA family potassium uptake protein [Chloroflexota bacterium]
MAKKQVAVIGLGRFGSSVARTLYQIGHDVLAIDNNDKAVQSLVGQVTYPVKADATDEAALREMGVSNFDVAVVAIGGDLQSSLLTTVLLKRLGVPYLIARAQNELHGATLEKLGADNVVYPEGDMGVQVAHSLGYKNVLDYTVVGQNYGVVKLKLPDRYVGMTLEEAGLSLQSKSSIAALLVKRGNDVILMPDRFERIQEGDIFVVAGKDEQLEKLQATSV